MCHTMSGAAHNAVGGVAVALLVQRVPPLCTVVVLGTVVALPTGAVGRARADGPVVEPR